MDTGTPEDLLTDQHLRSVGIEDTGRAIRTLRGLAGSGVSDDDLVPLFALLLPALQRSPDAERALQSFARWFAAVGAPTSYLQRLIHAPEALRLFCRVTGSSQYFADLIVRNPEYFAILEDPGPRGGTRSTAYYYRQLSALVAVCRQTEMKRDALRRWKAREMLRIGVRDLVGLADLSTTVREFSHLADACIQGALDITLCTLELSPQSPRPRFAVIAMGKLGGLELNYSSDIDLIFVHEDALPDSITLANGRSLEPTTYLNRLSETLIKTLAEETAQGHVFRVDMRLRPEGRFGPLTRSLSSFRAYYENWAEGWERQALLKARFVAGDHALGHAFHNLVEPFVFRRHLSSAFLEEIRANKRRIEQKCRLENQTWTNVKTGYGGIRDVEFLVQSLQLQYGYRRKNLRTPNTLSALLRLHHAHLLTDADSTTLAQGYIFLRNLEHRLQLLNGFQTQNLPEEADAVERTRVALRMGYTDRTSFESDLQRHRTRIHQLLQSLFYGDEAGSDVQPSTSANGWQELPTLLDNLDSPTAEERLKALLVAHGFRALPAALRALQLPMRGNEFGEMPPDTPLEFKQIAPDLMDRIARSPDPDAALAGVEALALAVPNRAQLYAAFDDSPDLMDRVVRLGAGSPPLLKRLANHLEWFETLLSPDAPPSSHANAEEPQPSELADPPTSSLEPASLPTASAYSLQFQAELRRRKPRATKTEDRLNALSLLFQREALRIGAQEIWEETDVLDTMQHLTALAEATLQALLDLCIETMLLESSDPRFDRAVFERVAIIGLGKLGGVELGYASDWDILCVYDMGAYRNANDATRAAQASALVEQLVARITDAAQKLLTRGAHIEIDLRLRPWGRTGALALTPRGYLEYYRNSGETWERQAALKARYVAGNSFVGRRLMRLLRAVSFGRGLTPKEELEVVAMKRRMEQERLKPEERETDLKLGYGGLSDIEWIAQRLQMRHGPKQPALRQTNTLQALSALASLRLLDNAEAELMIATYLLLARVRNALWLQTAQSQDTLPSDASRLRALAKQLGYPDSAGEAAEAHLQADITHYRHEVRMIFQRRFYETTVS